MRRRHFFHTVGEAFPAGNHMSKVMWSLMLIQADLVFEATQLIEETPLPGRDTAQRLHEVFYYVRGTLRSLYSAQKQLAKLTGKAAGGEFEELARSADRWAEFRSLRREVNSYAKHFERYRNAFGAHSEESIEESLAHADRHVIVGQSILSSGLMGHEFAAEVITAVSEQHLGKADSGALRAEVERLHEVARACIRCVQLATAIYATRYPVFRRS